MTLEPRNNKADEQGAGTDADKSYDAGAAAGSAAGGAQTLPLKGKPVRKLKCILGSDDLGETLKNDFGRYRDFAAIGSGGVGTVQSCMDLNLGRRVAVKVLHPHLEEDEDQRIRFLREARIMAQLEHPNIVPVHELGVREDGSIYFTMKQLHGTSLYDVLQKLRQHDRECMERYPLARLIDIFSHICQATAFAHSRSVIHRDLKPENVQIGDFAEVQVMDWGLVKIIGAADEQPVSGTEKPEMRQFDLENLNTTLDGQISGTPRYMAPEQALGLVSKLDERSDVYSLGAILYEMLTLQYYVNGEYVNEILRQVIHAQPVPPRQRAPQRKISRELNAICMKCLAKQKEERYRNAVELVHDLDRYQRGLTVVACPESMLCKLRKICRRLKPRADIRGG